MRVAGLLAAAVAVAAAAGCTHRSLTRHTVLATSTVMDIQYASVLANLAMLSCHPDALPNHVHLADGVVQINDRAGFGRSGGFTALGNFGIESFGPDGQRQVTEQWGTDATTDPERLYDLQSLYRTALGLPTLPPPNAIAYIRREQQKDGKDGRSREKDKGGSSGHRPDAEVTAAAAQSGTASTGGGGSTPGGGSSSSGDGEHRRVPLDVLLTDVPPPGWYHVGGKKDVPACARYVGRWGDRYAWVLPDGVPELSRFTLTVLTVIKLKPGERGGRGGLAVTASGGS